MLILTLEPLDGPDYIDEIDYVFTNNGSLFYYDAFLCFLILIRKNIIKPTDITIITIPKIKRIG